MSLTSAYFFVFIVAVLALYYISSSRIFRTVLFAVANAVFIASYAVSFSSLLPLIFFLVFAYGCIHRVKTHPNGAPAAVLVAAIILLFIWLKHYSVIAFVPALPFPYLLIGLSYILFRVLHLMFDVRDGELEAPGPLDYFVYTCFFLSFVSGPIQRYQDFATQRHSPQSLTDDTAYAAFARIFRGYIKICVVAEILRLAQQQWLASLLGALDGAHPAGIGTISAHYALSAVLYGFYLYANFSGYMDLMIGVGRLFGLDLPENFDRPWRAANFLDFWSRWHITLSQWFRTYFFNPLLKAMMHRFPAPKAAPYLAAIAFFATFLVLGAWHGASSEYLLCGLLFGAGVSINQLYQVEMTRRLGKRRYQALARNGLYRTLSRGLTLGYYLMAMTTFWLSMPQILTLATTLGALGLLLSLALLTLAIAVIVAALDWVAGWGVLSLFAAPKSLFVRCACLGAVAVLLAMAVPWIGAPAGFVYQAF